MNIPFLLKNGNLRDEHDLKEWKQWINFGSVHIPLEWQERLVANSVNHFISHAVRAQLRNGTETTFSRRAD